VLLLFFLAEMMGENPQGATRWNHFVELSAEKQRDSRNARTERTTFESPRLHHKRQQYGFIRVAAFLFGGDDG